MSYPWSNTDADCCQYMRNDGTVYEMIQAVWLDRVEKDIKNGVPEYCICRGEIDLNSYEDEEVLSAISSYGYTIVGLLEQYGDAALDIIAECILEEEIARDSCIVDEANSFEEAKEKIEKIIEND